jgi:hypothetical protein
MGNTTKQKIGEELGKALLPLKHSTSSSQNFEGLMYRLGWEINVVPTPISDLVTTISLVESDLSVILNGGATIQDYESLYNSVKLLISEIQSLGSADFSSYPALISDGFLTIFPTQLVDHLIVEYLLNYQPPIGTFLQLTGVITVSSEPPIGNRPAYTNRKIEWSNIPLLVSDPKSVFESVYGWGTINFNSALFLKHWQEYLLCVGYISFFKYLPNDQVEQLKDGVTADSLIEDELQLNIPFFEQTIGGINFSGGMALFPVPGDGLRYPGLSLIPYAKGDVSQQFEIRDNWYFNIEGNLDIQGGIGITLRPEENIKAFIGFDDPSTGSFASGELFLQLINTDQEGNPILIFGSAGATRLEYASVSLSGGIRINTAGTKELFIEVELVGANLVIEPEEGDGFLKKVLPEGGFEINTELAVGISSEHGFYFRGSGGLEIQLPTHIEIGPIDIQNIKIGMTPINGVFPIKVGADIGLALGPFAAIVEGIGVRADLEFPGSGGNLGPVDASIGFKPPTGIGFSIDSSGFKGGGFLSFDFDQERYVGALELTVKDKVSLKVIGILTTKLPGNDDGFSLLLLITAEFQPINLGFGFTLNGVGGLIALHRTMNLNYLRDGVKANTLDNILFPTDPIANINQIISDLEGAFPVQEGRYAFGPMAIIGWGTPTLISIELGLMIEVPNPVRIAILGVVKAILPTEQKSLLKLQVNFLGTLDFEAKFITFDASIFASKLLSFTLEGDMAFRLKYGDNPNFLFSIGGFHPAYTPPPLQLPSLKRLTINLVAGDNPRITLTAYFALTSNTVQFGSAVDFYYKITNKYSVVGYLGFDILIQFNPFYLMAQIAASLALMKNGNSLASIYLGGSVAGPAPWHVKGKAELEICGITLKANFDKTFGQPEVTTLPDVLVLPKLVEALGNRANWQASTPSSSNLLVSLRELDSTPGNIVAHPFGTLGVSQKVVPLDMTINKFGTQRPADYKKFELDIADSTGTVFEEEALKDFFAPAEYLQLNDSAKLSRKSFEQFNSGVSIKGNNKLKSSYLMDRELMYEQVIMDSRNKPEKLPTLYAEKPIAFRAFTKNGTAAKSSLGSKIKPISQNSPAKVSVTQEGFAIAFTEDLGLYQNLTTGSEAEARVILDQLLANDPKLTDKIQVVPQYQVA